MKTKKKQAPPSRGHSHAPPREAPVPGGHLGESQTAVELPTKIRRLLDAQTPPHLLTVRRKR